MDLIERYRRYEDPDAGITEEFLQPTLGLGRTVGVLSRPLGPARGVGFVICHSFGMEQIHLSRFDALTARSMAAAGFPVLRFHGHGYGDSDAGMESIRLSSHVAESIDAVHLLRELTGVQDVGMMGARIGGTAAALVADREDLPLLAMWEPAIVGAQYVKFFLRSQLLHKMVLQAARSKGTASGSQENGEPVITVAVLREQLASQGWADIKGFQLTRMAHDELMSVDLLKDVTRFRGKALIASFSRTGRISSGAAKLVQHLQSLGAECSTEVMEDRSAANFGLHHHSNVPGGTKVDTQFALSRSLAKATVAWAEREASTAPSTREVRRS